MACGGECVCEAMEKTEPFHTLDIGIVYIQISKKKMGSLVDTAEVHDGTLHFEETTVEEEEEGFRAKVEIENGKQAKHLYELLADGGYPFHFEPQKERILLDCPEITSTADMMQDFIYHCKHNNLVIVYLKPRKNLAFECFSLEEIYEAVRFCEMKNIAGYKFYCTDLAAIQKRQFVRHHTINFRDYM